MIDQLVGKYVLVHARRGPSMCGHLSQVKGSTVLLVDATPYDVVRPPGHHVVYSAAVLRGVVSVLAFKEREQVRP